MDLTLRAVQNSGTTPVRPGFELDVDALGTWLGDHVPGFDGPLAIDQFKGGQSNPTYRLATPGAVYVLRSKPKGPLLSSAHAIDREYRVLSALAGTAVPVPRVHALCTDEAVIGRWFYVMDHDGGPIVWDLPADRWSPVERGAIWRAGADAAAALHAVDVDAVGLRDFGKTGGYVARQFRRWSGQYIEHTRDAIDNPALDRLVEWLPERLPAEEPTAIIHGDLQLSNMILRDDLGAVSAIIDWELSTLGNPVSDFAYYCRDYHVPREAGGFGDDPGLLGIPPEEEVVARWSAATGFPVGADWMIYIVFNMFRLAAIRQGVAKRIKQGTATSANAEVAATGAVTMADNAWRIARSLG